ncbi:MAG: glycine cleavage system protein GcvH [Deltaproteobacteria bacterium]|nr:glycine cleavage system protein GcvH [Deltaproteobacteria bacterium]
MEIEGYNFPDDLYYDKNHFWARVEGELVVMGATEFTSKLAGEITYVDLPEEEDEVTQGKPFGSIESGKWVGRVYAVVSGEVSEINEDLEDEPEAINEDPYSACKIKPSDAEAELKNLMKTADLGEFVRSELERIKDQIEK